MLVTERKEQETKEFLDALKIEHAEYEVTMSRADFRSISILFAGNGVVQEPEKLETLTFSDVFDYPLGIDIKNLKILSASHKESEFMVVSDLTSDALKEMKNQGFEPYTLVETAPDIFQATIPYNNSVYGIHEAKEFIDREKALNFKFAQNKELKESQSIIVPGFPAEKDSDFVPRFVSFNKEARLHYINAPLNTLNDITREYKDFLKQQEQGKPTQEQKQEPTKEPTQPGQEPTKEPGQQQEPTQPTQPTKPGQEPPTTAKIVEPTKQQETVEKTIASQTPDIVASILAAVKAIINAVVKTITLGICQPFPNAMAQKPVEQQKDLTKEQSKPEKTVETKEQSQPERDMSQVPPAPAFAPGVENAPFATPQNPEVLKNQIARETQEKAKAQEKEQQQQKGKGKTKEKTRSRERSGPSL